jgi:DNA primase
MGNIQGLEFHSIIQNIFGDVNGLNVSEQLQVNCPRCQERDGLRHPDGKYNLEINTRRRLYRCWRCDEPKFSGSLGRLIRMLGSNADYEIYKSYAGILTDYEYSEDEKEYVQVKLPEEMILFSQMEAGNLQHFEAYNYLVNERKISRDIILKYRLGFCTTGRYANRIIIPSYDMNGEVNYFVARTYDPKEKKRKYDNPKSDKDVIIFNEGFINWDSTVYLVEGVTDMFSLPNAIPMLGKTISSTLYMKLKKMMPDVVILLDPDAYKNSIELFYKLQTIYVGCEEKVKIVKLPTTEDIDELRRNQGIEEVIKSLYTARGLTIDDYFINKLRKPYEYKRGGFDSSSKDYEWKSGSTRSFL